jgi:hypothetical protein
VPEARPHVLLQEVAAALEQRVRLPVRARDGGDEPLPELTVTGSESLNAVRNGLSHVRSTSQARRLSGTATLRSSMGRARA